MHEIAPGIRHWTAPHPNIGADVSSYWLPELRVLLDPLAVPEEVDAVDEIVLSNRHHKRDMRAAHERFGAPVRVPRVGLNEFDDGDPVDPYDFEEPFADGAITAYQVTEYWPDDCALHIPSANALAIADTVVGYGGIGFVPDNLMGDDAEAEKRDIKKTLARLADELEFEHLLFAHGAPIPGEGRERLREFASS
jgi:glyoxylase-like metal-dependent hydrolase (beta-lactamase superfamily II)